MSGMLSLKTLLRMFSRDKEFRALHPQREFRRILARERARADRAGDTFSLLSLGVKDWERGESTMLYLAGLLRRRLRLTDEAGWLDNLHLGIVMPSTLAWGAWTLADDLCLSFPDRVPPPHCKVYVYPGDWSPEEHDWAEQPRTRRRMPRRAETMEPLFIQRLPLWKRSMDIVISALGLALLSPVFLLVALVVKLSSPGPVLFLQRRSGLGGRPFVMYKFRTMIAEAERHKESLRALSEQDGPAFKIKRDPRTTRVGRILRTTSIDELPQLWNVLKGEMSLVGPRPLPCDEAEGCRGWRRWRVDVTPGLTCIWQVTGRSRVSFDDWARMDLKYARRRSLLTDLKLLVRTVVAVLRGNGS
jgi:lipopolysaccharide/colanic/teichoic acid biosynthesis glycosyltransferase